LVYYRRLDVFVLTRSVLIGFSLDKWNKLSHVVLPFGTLAAGCATNRYFQVLGNIHDLESYFGIDNVVSLNANIFLSHWGHIAIIFMWLSGNLFHVGWTGNYDIWTLNPIKTIPIAHSIFDPHFGSSEIENNVAYSGLYNLLSTIGFSCVSDIYAFLILSECLALASILLALVHLIYLDSYLLCSPNIAYATKTGLSDLSKLEIEFRLQLMVANTLFIWPIRLFTACFDLSGERLNYHIGALIGFFSIAWAGHIIHHALPFSRSWHNYIN
jgi:photosystem I P700 chlorophyll a apoprotein A2